jgi:predicted phosphoribosyltransferase
MLADRLSTLSGMQQLMVLGLPRGGIPVAAEVAEGLHAPLDAICVRKLGVPGHEELAMGAIASGGVRVQDDAALSMYGVPSTVVDRVAEDEAFELARRERCYRDGRPAPDLTGRIVILVDDGLATGATMRAAVRAARQQHPARVIVAIPVAPKDAVALLKQEADQVVVLTTPEPFFAVGTWYDAFEQTSDAEVKELLGAHVTSGAQ